MARSEYIGARYVPVLADPVEWSPTKVYEALTIVTHEGNSYTSRQYVPVGIDIDNTEFWAETGNYNAQIEQYRRETATALETALYARLAVDPDMFDGTDVEKIEQAVGVIGVANGTILIRRRYTLTRNLLISRRGNTQSAGSSELVNTRLTFVGIGADAIIDCDDYSITAATSTTSYGMLAFKDIAFTGSETFMNVDYIIRVNFDNCSFEKFDVCFTIPRFMQSYYFTQCTFRQINCIFFASGAQAGCTDMQLNECLIETCYKVYNCYYAHGVTFNQCCIEGNYDVCFTIYGDTRPFNVVNCYFEGNNDTHNTDVGLPAGDGLIFDFTGLAGTIQAITIQNNQISTLAENAYIIDVGSYNPTRGFLSIKNNRTSLNINLIRYSEERTARFTWIYIEGAKYSNVGNPKMFRMLDDASLASYNALASGMDLNELPTSGIWYKPTTTPTSEIAHMPSDVLDSAVVTLLHIQATATAFSQILFTTNGLYTRNQQQSAWNKSTATNVSFVE